MAEDLCPVITDPDTLQARCLIGQGAACCRYLVGSRHGIECAKREPSLRDQLDARVAAGTMVACGDNCPGWGVKPS